MSPQWHRRHLMDLLAMVEAWGLPKFFMTLTADELSATRWPEMRQIDEVLARLNKDFNWSDAPVGCARIFVARLNEFMKTQILSGPEIVGKVLHYVIRYEEQSRGSLHAHVMLWTASDSVERVRKEIVDAVLFRQFLTTFWESLSEPTRVQSNYFLISSKETHARL
jgi:hypothetical protein